MRIAPPAVNHRSVAASSIDHHFDFVLATWSNHVSIAKDVIISRKQWEIDSISHCFRDIITSSPHVSDCCCCCSSTAFSCLWPWMILFLSYIHISTYDFLLVCKQLLTNICSIFPSYVILNKERPYVTFRNKIRVLYTYVIEKITYAYGMRT